MWDETNAPIAGIIKRNTRFPQNSQQWIISGPHIGVATPFQKCPRRVCFEKSHYDLIDLTGYLPHIFRVRTTRLRLLRICILRACQGSDGHHGTRH